MLWGTFRWLGNDNIIIISLILKIHLTMGIPDFLHKNLQMCSMLYLNLCLKLILKGRGPFIKPLLLQWTAGVLNWRSDHLKSFTLLQALGGKSWSHKEIKTTKNWAFVLYVFSYNQPIIRFNHNLYSLLLCKMQ